MPHADVNGQQIHYEDSGGDDDVVVFSHGFLMDHSMFDPQVAALRDRWRCVTWDERGHGATQTSDDDFSYWDSAGDLWGLLDHLGVERAVLAGMSQGGFLSLRAALTAPERVRALVMMDSQAGVEDPQKLEGYNQLIEAWGAPGGPPQQVLDIVAGIILGDGWAGTADWQARWREYPAERMQQIYRTLTSREDVTERLGELDVPALVIHGGADAAIDVPTATVLAEGLGAQIEVIPEAGHAANLTHPEAVNTVLVTFLERV